MESGRIENREGMEKWKDIRDFNFPYLCLIGRVEKLMDEKKKFLIQKKNGGGG